MNTIIKLVYKDFIRFTKDRPAFLLTFVVPVVLIIIFANIFGDGKPAGKVPVILVNESKSIVAKYLESKIDSSKSLRPVKEWKDNSTGTVKKIDEEKAKELVKEGNYSAAIVMPNDFFTDTSSSLKFKYYYDPKSDVETAIIQGEFQKTIMTQMPRLMPLLFQKQIESSMGNLKASGFK